MRELVINILPVCIALGVGAGVMVVGGRLPPRRKLGGRKVFESMVRKRDNRFGIKYWLDSFLTKNGAIYHYGKRCGAKQLFIVSLLMMAVGWMVGLKIAIYVSAIAAVVGMLLPWLLLPVLNHMDNEKILPDLRLVYHALAMQIKAGVYVTDALAEMYSGVENRRFKEALLDLGGDIVLKADINAALERFQNRFDNRYIDSLCITVIQAMESGQAVELLSDIAEQVKDMEKMVLEKQKANLDRSITFYQLGMLACVLAVAIYACISNMFSTTLGF